MRLMTLQDHLHLLLFAIIAYPQCWSVSSGLTVLMGIPAGLPRTANLGAAKITQKAW
jgi:hypothetical protein